MTRRYHLTRRTQRALIGAAIAAVAILAGAQAAPALPSPTQLLKLQPGLLPVTHVSDGDTITVRTPAGEDTVRLLGVDTPEVKDPRKPVQCFGQAASAHTKARLTGQSVRLEPDPTNNDRDKYGRLLRYIYLPDGTLYNAELIREGYAFAYTVFPLVRLDEFRTLEREARAANRGLWGGCNINEADKIKQTQGAK
jgi:micrococcal nuclease